MASQTILVVDDSPTILKVVQLVLSKAGYEVHAASDGDEGVELARQVQPDLILLDFVMPRMNGYQFCRALHEEPGLAEVPVVLMSAKGDQVGDRFVKVMGIVDYISKPFSPEAIVTVVEHCLDRRTETSAEEISASMLLPELSPEAIFNAADAEMQQRRAALANLRASLAGLLAGQASDEGFDAAAMAALAARALGDDQLLLLIGELRATAPELAGADDAVLTGDLAVVPLAEVLLLVSEQQQTGMLTVARGEAQVDLHFHKGALELATAAGVNDEYLLGRFIVENELMSQADLDLFLKSRSSTAKLLGHQLVKLGYLKASELKVAIRQQTLELVYELLRWGSGRFTLRAGDEAHAVARDASLELSVQGLLLEGLRRVDEWHLISREISDFEAVFLRNEDTIGQLGRGQLTREELMILELVNGKNTVKDIVRQSKMGSFDVTQIFYRLLAVKLIRDRVAAVAS